MQWEFIPESGQWTTSVDGRAVTIAWDEGDRSLYLSVVIPPPPNVAGAQAHVYAAPLSLLAATLLLPKDEHPGLFEIVRHALEEARDGIVIDQLGIAVDQVVRPWPATARAHEAIKAAQDAMTVVERLSLDLATEGAWR